MASQAQINEQKWQQYVDSLAKAGLSPAESQCKGYALSSNLWNNVDTEAIDDFQRVMSSQEMNYENRPR